MGLRLSHAKSNWGIDADFGKYTNLHLTFWSPLWFALSDVLFGVVFILQPYVRYAMLSHLSFFTRMEFGPSTDTDFRIVVRVFSYMPAYPLRGQMKSIFILRNFHRNQVM